MRVLRFGGRLPAKGWQTLRPFPVVADLPGPQQVDRFVTRQRVNALEHLAATVVNRRRPKRARASAAGKDVF
jgi:hypothetical protein